MSAQYLVFELNDRPSVSLRDLTTVCIMLMDPPAHFASPGCVYEHVMVFSYGKRLIELCIPHCRSLLL